MEAMKLFFRSHGSAGFAAIVIGAVLLAFSMGSVAQDYAEPETCTGSICHDSQYNDWKVSGHPYKLMRGEDAQNRPIPLPEGYTWDDISWVIGGYKWKSRYMDNNGYILTQDGSSDGGNTQYNNFTGMWSDYNADLENGTKPYDCGRCHTTGWVENPDPTNVSGNKDELPGIHGDFFAGGIQCQQCHGTSHPGNIPAMDDLDGSGCGSCHIRGEADTIPASGGFVRHHEQYNEHLASPHAADMCTLDACPTDCADCHNPHKRGEFSIKTACGDCHTAEKASYEMTSMYDYDVTCEDCHMPFATKSAQALGPVIDGNQTRGDVMTHILSINTDPMGDMFTEDGGFVALDDNGKAAVTMNFTCQRCHETATLEELAKFAVGFHDRSGPLDGIGIDPGLSGHWWDSDREGEGFMMEVAYVGDDLFLFVSFYAYDAEGNRTYLFAQGFADGTSLTVPVTIVLPEGGSWGADFDEADVMRPEWGSGTFTFGVDCETADFEFTANQAALDAGYTDIMGSLTRDLLEVGIACPTFVNNAGDMAAAQ